MSDQSHFIFSLSNRHFGIDAAYVDEVFALPELTLTMSASRDIVGVVNLRGSVIPVMDLNLSLGSSAVSYQLTDSLVVLKWKELRVGIIANAVQEVKEISPQEITAEPLQQHEWATVERKKIIAGIVKDTEDIVILSNPGNWFLYAEMQQFMPIKDSLEIATQDNHEAAMFKSNGFDSAIAQQFAFCPDATLEEKEIFHRRADSLKLSDTTPDLKKLRPLVVITLDDNFFGIDVEMVREFVDIRKVTPVPSSPAYIIGNVNLRGEILTLIDIRESLNPSLTNRAYSPKAMVVEVENIISGVIVEEICDVMFLLNPKEIVPANDAIRPNHINNSYLQGMAPYREKMMMILDLQKMFQDGELIVDEVI
jgi:purine-binding chemotaxis protein CheW